MMMKLILSLCVAGVLLFVGTSARSYPLRPYELTDLDNALKYYMVKQLEKNINDTFDEYQSLAYQCAGMVNATADSCKNCVTNNKNCGNSGDGGGNPVQEILGLVDQNVKNLFNGLGQMSQNLFNNIGNSIGGEIGASINGLKNKFSSISSHISGITGIGTQFKGLEIIFSGILKGTEEKLKAALQTTKQTLSNIGKGIQNTFNKIKDELSKKIPFFKRSLLIRRDRRELNECYLQACPDCRKVNLPDNATDAQLEQVMANVCGDVYTKQTAAKTKIENYMKLVGELLTNNTIVDEFIFSYENRVEKMESFKFTLLGRSRAYTPKTVTEIDTRDLTGLGELITSIILKLLNL